MNDPKSRNVADDNVERLLSHAYAPEPPQAEFVERVKARLREAVSARASHPTPVSAIEGEPRPAWWKLATFGAIAATVVWAMFAFVARPERETARTSPAVEPLRELGVELGALKTDSKTFDVSVHQLSERLK